MASFFKVSCSIYWLGWFFYMSYLLGIEFYIDSYIIKTQEVIIAEFYVKLLCIFNVSYCIIGCVFVKCNIIHVFYAICYILPILGVNITCSIMAVLSIRGLSSTLPIRLEDMEVKYGNNQHGKWLTIMERNAHCCGLLGYLDYPAFLSKKKNKKGKKLKDFIPSSCCKIHTEKTCLEFLDIKFIGSGSVSKNNTYDSSKRMNMSQLFRNTECPLTNEQKQKAEEIFRKNSEITFSPNKSIGKVLNTCGCFKNLNEAHQTVYETAHFVFLISNFMIVCLMTVVYIRNWCTTRNKPGGSNHSLDTDDMSILNISIPVSSQPQKVKAKTAIVENVGDHISKFDDMNGIERENTED